MSERNSQLAFLLSRLMWPAAPVSERAADALAGLLVADETSTETLDALLSWLGEQKLESATALGLLSLVRAADCDPAFVPPPSERLAQAIARPSILSQMLLEELDRAGPEPLDWSRLHSPDAPDGFVPSPFFDKYLGAFIPPVYALRASQIEQRALVPFTRQWAFEYRRLMEEMGLRESASALNFRGREHEEHYGPFNTRLSEVYRSSYLRTLAWTVARGGLTEAEARKLAVGTCPIDLDLWRVRMTSPPHWWPGPIESTEHIDTIPAQVWSAVDTAWRVQCNLATTRLIVRAGGRVHEGGVVYDLDIFGAFQRKSGASQPEPADIAAALENEVVPHRPQGLRFAGELGWVEPEAVAMEMDDWIVVPASAITHPASSMPWQSRRAWRGLVLPMPYLAGRDASFRCVSDAVEVVAEGQVVATWHDWSFRLREIDLANLSPSTGFVLEVNRELVEAVEAGTGMAFIWVCKLTGYHRRHTYQRYETFSNYYVFGARRIVLP